MTYKKLSAEQISETILKIRNRYDMYCKMFFKSRRIKDAFEERYRNSLKAGVDVSNFLLAELSAIDEMIRIEEEKSLKQKPLREKPKEEIKTVEKIESFYNEQLKEYREIRVHKDAREIVSRLLGALTELYDVHLPNLDLMIRNSTAAGSMREFAEIESSMRNFCQAGKEKVPPKLTRYITHLARFPRDYKAIEWEEKEYVRESALLLNDLKGIVNRVTKMSANLTIKERKNLRVITEYLDRIIDDFHLKELKRP
ncbi:MAG: hypothetical protein JW969_06820 [Spirochaetales bacterium]|nr:hypothetical protein [Spirochaetales bacterium]